ncbi:MAG: response regulator [Spirochaetaceae bacterium]|jgi:signal transduction histidine kinase/HAMP domain-containing protein/BarA-like signal transduction histidine kinase|nr:response regulator [Spirochaetaceae bacterium]
MKEKLYLLRSSIERFIARLDLGMRAKLIIIFVVIKVIPLIILTFFAWRQALSLGREMHRRTVELTAKANTALEQTGTIAVTDSVKALNDFATDDIERISTGMANEVANFLYQRDGDILYAAGLSPTREVYRHFIESQQGRLVKSGSWELAPDGKSWVPAAPSPEVPQISSSNQENDTNFRYRSPDVFEIENRPLYLEMTYIDLRGNELIKVTTSPLMDPRLKNISDRKNTYVKAETYFEELKNLKPGEIYVSDVIGAYVPSRFIGMYTPENTAARGLAFTPEEEAYAGMENPLGKRFKGLIRWVTPVTQDGGKDSPIIAYVSLALDHDHLMEFTDHTTPMRGRFTELPSAYEGNYAFIWDYKCRSICHPRHHSIVGYNPETGDPEVPWLEESIYQAWQASGKTYVDFIQDQPVFVDQSRDKKPAAVLTAQGLVGLDGRYLNHAPQCTGWFDLTSEGGSGSFLILWSGLWKLTTAATIPYYTGHYGQSKRGFGFVAIGAGFEDFQRPAMATEATLNKVITQANQDLTHAEVETRNAISANILDTTLKLTVSAGLMIFLVVLIAIWMASIFTKSITTLINGISRFRSGERHFRFNAKTKDELGTLADSFDEMADSLVASDRGPLIITDTQCTIIYINTQGLKTLNKTLDQVLGQPYREVSVYPSGSKHDPIAALLGGYEAEILYDPENKQYIRGSATYLTEKNGAIIGYVIISMDLTEMVEQQHLLEKAVQAANRANEHKGDFLARMSHEIRTPMNAIIGMTGIVKKKLVQGVSNTEDIQANIRQIEVSSQHLLGLLNDILDISKIEAGKIEMSLEAVDMFKLVHTVETIIRPRCEEKNIAFVTRFEMSKPAVYQSDSLRLRQVLINLLGNAVKFTPELGRIEFTILEKKHQKNKTLLEFIVRDNGIGISETAQKMLFKPFEQGGGQIAKQYGGTGLGLAISKSIVQLFGGNILVTSKEGSGSTFSFELWLSPIQSGENPESALENTTGSLTGKRALLVDDVEINRIITQNLLEFTGISIDEAADGLNALTMFQESQENTYDIIYMDVQMPVMDGYEATAAIRSLERADAKTVPIVALTANAFKEDIDRAMQAGMNAHLAKPLDTEKLLEVSFQVLHIR